MTRRDIPDATAAFEKALARPQHYPRYVLRLYVAGASPKSLRAIVNIQKICEEHLEGLYELEVINIYEHPKLAAGEQIMAVPTLIRKLPLPLRRLIGDLSNTERVLVGLDLRKKELSAK